MDGVHGSKILHRDHEQLTPRKGALRITGLAKNSRKMVVYNSADFPYARRSPKGFVQAGGLVQRHVVGHRQAWHGGNVMRQGTQNQVFQLEALEPRVLLSGDALVTAAACLGGTGGFNPASAHEETVSQDFNGCPESTLAYNAVAQVEDIFSSGFEESGGGESQPASADDAPVPDDDDVALVAEDADDESGDDSEDSLVVPEEPTPLIESPDSGEAGDGDAVIATVPDSGSPEILPAASMADELTETLRVANAPPGSGDTQRAGPLQNFIGAAALQYKGSTGDVIAVDVPGSTFQWVASGLTPQSDGTLIVEIFGGGSAGTIFPIEKFSPSEQFALSGKFYFVPSIINDYINGDADYYNLCGDEDERGFTGNVVISIRVDGQQTTVEIEIGKGFSTMGEHKLSLEAGASLSAVGDRSKILRLEQRLRYLGFPDEKGDQLTVDGILDSNLADKNRETKWAVGVFNRAVVPNTVLINPGNEQSLDSFPSDMLNGAAVQFFNAENAPRWVLLAPDGYVRSDIDDRSFGTSWLNEVLSNAASVTAPTADRLGQGSRKSGGPFHSSHYSGLAVDVDIEYLTDYDPARIDVEELQSVFPFFYFDSPRGRVIVPIEENGVLVWKTMIKLAKASGGYDVKEQLESTPVNYVVVSPNEIQQYRPFFATDGGRILASGPGIDGTHVEAGYLAQAESDDAFVVVADPVSLDAGYRFLGDFDLLTQAQLTMALETDGLDLLGRLEAKAIAKAFAGPVTEGYLVRNQSTGQFTVVQQGRPVNSPWELQTKRDLIGKSVLDLLWQNSDIYLKTTTQYDRSALGDQLQSLLTARTVSGATTRNILYNDPHFWRDSDNIRWVQKHEGHFHLNIQPPQPGAIPDQCPVPLGLGNPGQLPVAGIVVVLPHATELPLEDAVAGITPDKSLALTQGLETTFDALSAVHGVSTLAVKLFNNSTLVDIVAINENLRAAILAPIQIYLRRPDPTIEGLVAELELQPTITGVVGEYSSDQSNLEFSVSYRSEYSRVIPFDAISELKNFSIEFELEGSLELNLSLAIDFTFGLDFMPGVEVEEAFYLRPGRLSLSAEVAVLSFDANVIAGVLKAEVVNGSFILNASAAVDLVDPDNDGRLSVNELLDRNVFVDAGATGYVNVRLPMRAAIAGRDLTTGPLPTIFVFDGQRFDDDGTLTGDFGDLFDSTPPEFLALNFERFLDFTNIGPFEVLGFIKQFADWLEQFRNSAIFDTRIPFASGKTLGDGFDFSKAFVDGVYKYVMTLETVGLSRAPPADGNVGAISFAVQIDDAAAVAITVSPDTPISSVEELATRLDGALDARFPAVRAVFTGQFDVDVINGRLRIRSTPAFSGNSFKLLATPNDLSLGLLGFGDGQESDEEPRFRSVQDLAELLSEALDPDGDGPLEFDVRATYNSTNKEVTLAISLNYLVENLFETGFKVDPDLGALGALADFQAGGTVRIGSDRNEEDSSLIPLVSLSATLGLDLNAKTVPELVTSYFTPPPLDGRLARAANFYVIVDGERKGVFTLANGTFGSLAGLASALQSSLSVDATLAGQVEFLVVPGENRIKLKAHQLGQITSLRIIPATADDSIVTEIGFSSQDIARSEIKGLFVENAALAGNISVSAKDLSASARFGVLEIELEGASAWTEIGSASASLSLRNPTTGTSRLYLDDLFDHLPAAAPEGAATGAGVVAPSFTLDGELNFALMIERVSPALIDPTGQSIGIRIDSIKDLIKRGPILDDTIFLTYPDVGALGNFQCADFADVLAGLQMVVNALESLKGFGFLNQELPLIDTSVSELVDYAGNFAQLVQQLRGANSSTIATLEKDIEDFFRIPASQLSLSMDGDTAVKFALSYDLAYGDTLPLHFNLAQLVDLLPDGSAKDALAGLADLVEVEGGGSLNVSAGAHLQLDFGIDITNPCEWSYFLYDTTSFSLTARVLGTGLDFRMGVGALGIYVQNGEVTLDADGDPDTNDDATFTVTLAGTDGDGRHYSTEPIFDDLSVVLVAGASATLPLYFPTQSMPLGGTGDLNGDTHPDNQLVVSIPDLDKLFGGDVSGLKIATPDLAALFSQINLCDLVTYGPVLLDGLDSLLKTIQNGLNATAFSNKLPLVGDKLGKAANFIEDFREGLLANMRRKMAEAGDPIGLIKEAIFNVLGPPGLNLLVHDANGAPITDPNDININFDNCIGENAEILFNLRLRKVATLFDSSADPISFDIGVDGLGLKVNGNVRVEAGFDLKLYFGLSAKEGFFFNTSANMADPELQVFFNASVPGLSATGELFFLQLQAKDRADRPSGFSGRFDVDILDPRGEGERLTFADLTGSGTNFEDIIDYHLDLSGGIHLDLEVSFGGAANFPRLLADFDLTASWNSNQQTLSYSYDFPKHRIRIDLGSFVSEFIQPILREIRKVTEPIDPLIRILTMKLPVLSDLAGKKITLLDLAEKSGYLSSGTRKFVEQIALIIQIVNSTPDVSGEISIEELAGLLGLDEAQARPEVFAMSPPGQASISGISGFFSDLRELGITFPFISPTEILKLFQGQAVSLVEYRMPVLEFTFSYTQRFPIWGPLFAKIRGTIGAKIELGFGYDTSGLMAFFASQKKDPVDLLNGFYVLDLDEAGEDIPEVTLLGALKAFASLDGGVASANVGGGLFLTVGFNLNDPNDDGKVRLKELINNAREDLRCIFDISGHIDVGLVASLETVVGSKEWVFATIELASFDLSCPTPILATNDGGVLTIHMGPDADKRAAVDTRDGDEIVTISDLGVGNGGRLIRVKWNDYEQEFSGVMRIVANGGNGDDTITLENVAIPFEIHGGAGDDTLIYTSATPHDFVGPSVGLFGDAGDDDLFGGEGADHLDGGSGDDTVRGGVGNDEIHGGSGDDLLFGDDGADYIYGEDGADDIRGGLGDDTLFGGRGNDEISGYDGEDTINGEEDNDTLYGGLDNDRMLGGLGGDEMYGEAGDDVLVGDLAAAIGPLHVDDISGDGDDTMSGGPGKDVLLGAGGNDHLFGGTYVEDGATQPTGAEDDGADFLDGGTGNDTLFADDAHAGMAKQLPGASIAGSVWFDEIAPGDDTPNGQRDPDEKGIPASSVSLYHVGESSPVATTVTDRFGEYTFTGLLPDTAYYLVFGRLDSLAFTSQDAGGDDGLDSDAATRNDPATGKIEGQTRSFILRAGQYETSIDAGLTVAPGAIPAIHINDVVSKEGNDGFTRLTFIVSLSNPSREVVTVCFKTRDGSALEEDNDYLYTSWTLTFEPGEMVHEVTVQVQADLTYEPDEYFIVQLGDAYHATVAGDGQGIATIINDDGPPTIAISDGRVPILNAEDGLQENEIFAEQAGELVFTVQLSNPSYENISVRWTTAEALNAAWQRLPDSAKAGMDYTTASDTITFSAGETVKEIRIGIINDPINEYDERFLVKLLADTVQPLSRASVADELGIGTILGGLVQHRIEGVTIVEEVIHDDPLPTLLISSPYSSENPILEPHVGTLLAAVTVELRGASEREVQVNFATGVGTARDERNGFEPIDYVQKAGTLIFAPGGLLTQTIAIEIAGDIINEEPSIEYFMVNLLGAQDAEIDANRAFVHVRDDDPRPVPDHGPWAVQFDSAGYTVRENVGSATITLLRIDRSSEPLVVYLDVFGGSAEAEPSGDFEADYTIGADGFLVQFAPDEFEKRITIEINDDDLIEKDETIFLELYNPAGGPARGHIIRTVITIVDDEDRPRLYVSGGEFSESAANSKFDLVVELPRVNGSPLMLDSDYVIAVHYRFEDGSARQITADYTGTARSVLFTPAMFVDGRATVALPISIIGDQNPELTETFFVVLSDFDPNCVLVEDVDAPGTIWDDDPVTVTGLVFQDLNGNGHFDSPVERGLADVTVLVGGFPFATSQAGQFTAQVFLGALDVGIDSVTIPEGSVLTTRNNPQTVLITLTSETIPPFGLQPAAIPVIAPESIANSGGFSNDSLFGGPGNDLLNGGGGDDWVVGGNWLGPCDACSGHPYDVTLIEIDGAFVVDPATLASLGFISGIVHRQGPDADASGVRVDLFGVGTSNIYELLATTFTEEDGTYSFGNLTPCRYAVRFFADKGYTFADTGGAHRPDLLTGLTTLLDVTDANRNLAGIDATLVPLPEATLGPWSVQFTAHAYDVKEDQGPAFIVISRTPDSFEPTFSFITMDFWGSAPPAAAFGVDYNFIDTVFDFGLEGLLKSFEIDVFEDILPEGLEVVLLGLFNPAGGPVTGSRGIAVLFIYDDPCPDNDELFGEDGDDHIIGDYGYFSNGTPTLLGGMGNDLLSGGDGNDHLYAGNGNDQLSGGEGDDNLTGGSQDDTYVFNGDLDAGSDTIYEEPAPFGGIDTLDFSSTRVNGITVELGTTSQQPLVSGFLWLTLSASDIIENVIGGNAGDAITGNSLDNILTGGLGNDILEGLAGDDTLLGAEGDDTYLFDADTDFGEDIIVELPDTATYTGGTDTLDFSETQSLGVTVNLAMTLQIVGGHLLRLTTGEETNDRGGEVIENLYGGSGDDTLTGNVLNNVIWGRDGNDHMDGGTDGYDVMKEERGGNWQLLVENVEPFRGVLKLLNDGQIRETNTFTAGTFDEISLTGDDNPNQLDASRFSGVVRLDGRGGADELIGGSGRNFFVGGSGNDTILGGTGDNSDNILIEERDVNFTLTDTFLLLIWFEGGQPRSETDTISNIDAAWLTGGPGENTIDASDFSGTVRLDGRGGTDTLIGTAKDDVITGAEGDDDLRGGDGDDIYVFDTDTQLGSDVISDTVGEDSLDFSGTTQQTITVDLALTTRQLVNGNLFLTLSVPDLIENVIGGARGDTLTGSDFANKMFGGPGNDVLTGRLGSDHLDGGEGIDRLLEGNRDGDIKLEPYILRSRARSDSQWILEDTLADIEQATMVGGSGANMFDASAFPGNVLLDGRGGDDVLIGGKGDDRLNGGADNDTLKGGEGSDIYVFNGDLDAGADIIDETQPLSRDDDLLDFSATRLHRIIIDLAASGAQQVSDVLWLTLVQGGPFNSDVIENVIGGFLDDRLLGNDLDNILDGGPGNDTLDGREHNDLLRGGPGDDTYEFTVLAFGQSDTVLERVGSVAGQDTLDFTSLGAGIEIDLSRGSVQSVVQFFLSVNLTNCHSIENVIGGSNRDTITGNDLDNRLTGGGGNDRLVGGRGNDTYVFDADHLLGTDTIIELPRQGTDTLEFLLTDVLALTVDLSRTGQQTAAVDDRFTPHIPHLALTLSAGNVIENVIGGAQADMLTGNSLDNIFTGGLGNDTIDGSGGIDRLSEARDGHFTLTNSTLTMWYLGPDLTLVFESDELVSIETATLTGGDGPNRLDASGFRGDVILDGGKGDDWMRGGEGDDILIGGQDNDSYVFDADSPVGSDTIVELPGEGTDTLDFSLTTTFGITVDLSTPVLQSVNQNLFLTLSAGDVIENVSGSSQADNLTGNNLNNLLSGGPGDDTYVFGESWGTDTIGESSDAGRDTLDFSGIGSNLTFNSGTSVSVSQGQNTVSHAAQNVEVFISGSGDDTFHVVPSSTTAFAPHAGDGTDTLNFNSPTQQVTRPDDSTINAEGRQTVTHHGFETININLPPSHPSPSSAASQPTAATSLDSSSPLRNSLPVRAPPSNLRWPEAHLTSWDAATIGFWDHQRGMPALGWAKPLDFHPHPFDFASGNRFYFDRFLGESSTRQPLDLLNAARAGTEENEENTLRRAKAARLRKDSHLLTQTSNITLEYLQLQTASGSHLVTSKNS